MLPSGNQLVLVSTAGVGFVVIVNRIVMRAAEVVANGFSSAVSLFKGGSVDLAKLMKFNGFYDARPAGSSILSDPDQVIKVFNPPLKNGIFIVDGASLSNALTNITFAGETPGYLSISSEHPVPVTQVTHMDYKSWLDLLLEAGNGAVPSAIAPHRDGLFSFSWFPIMPLQEEHIGAPLAALTLCKNAKTGVQTLIAASIATAAATSSSKLLTSQSLGSSFMSDDIPPINQQYFDPENPIPNQEFFNPEQPSALPTSKPKPDDCSACSSYVTATSGTTASSGTYATTECIPCKAQLDAFLKCSTHKTV